MVTEKPTNPALRRGRYNLCQSSRQRRKCIAFLFPGRRQDHPGCVHCPVQTASVAFSSSKTGSCRTSIPKFLHPPAGIPSATGQASLRSVAPDADGGILFKRRIFQKDSRGRLDGLRRLNAVKISKIGNLCVGVILPKPRQNVIHDEKLLVGGGQSAAFRTVTVAALGVIQPKIVVMRGTVKLLCKRCGILYDQFQHGSSGRAEIMSG